MLVGIILVTTCIEETLILDCILVIPVIIMVIPTTILMEIIVRCPLESNIKKFITSQKNFNALIEEKLLKIIELARNVDRISLDVVSLKLRSILLRMISMSFSNP